MAIKASRKQTDFLNLMFDDSIIEICGGGSAGGSKTSMICISILVNAKKFPGYKCAVCRKTMPALKLTTWEELKTTLRREGLKEKQDRNDKDWDYKVDNMSSQIQFKNGSLAIFMSLDLRGDEDLQRLGSTNLDDVFIDEAGEVAFEAYSVAKSRIGRGPASIMYHRPGKIILTCNPSQNFLREQFYVPYAKLGGGEFQKWKIGQTVNSKGETIDAFRCFLRATCYDNPFLPDSYIENLKSLPAKQRMRLYEGNWNYADDSDSLFTSDILAKCMVYELPDSQLDEQGNVIFDKYIGVDVADSGGDATVATLISDNIICDQIEITHDKNSAVPIARQYADKLEEFAFKHGFTKNESRHIAIEKNGVGVGLVSQMQVKGWRITEYLATGQNRSQYIYQLARDLDDGKVKMYYKLKNYEELRRELQAHKVNYDGKDPKVCPKSIVRQMINRSPDFSDSTYIANYCRIQIQEVKSHSRKFRFVNF